MRRIGWLGVGAMLGACLAGGMPAAAAPPVGRTSLPDTLAAPHAAGELVVRFRLGSDGAGSLAAVGSATALRLARAELVRLNDPSRLASELAALRARPDVELAEPNYLYHVASADPLYPQQWSLSNTGQRVEGAAGTPGADVEAAAAWAELGDAAPVVIGVLDSGVSPTQPDLAGQLAAGHDFVDGDDAPADGLGHGTHVTGIIAALHDNGIGIAGVAPNAKVMPLRVIDDHGDATEAAIVDAISWATARGVRVLNASLEGPGGQALHDALAAAPDTLLVTAAGNRSNDDDGDEDEVFPCRFTLPNVICVAATDSSDRLAPFSGHGADSVDLAAPGVDVVTPTRRSGRRSPTASRTAPGTGS